MSKVVKIPDCMRPNFLLEINGVRYSYPAGSSQEVPDDVAEAIEQHMTHKVEHPKVPAFNQSMNIRSDIAQENPNAQDYIKNRELVPVIKSAAVGDTVVVKAVDENGKPTEWETATIEPYDWYKTKLRGYGITNKGGVNKPFMTDYEAADNIPSASDLDGYSALDAFISSVSLVVAGTGGLNAELIAKRIWNDFNLFVENGLVSAGAQSCIVCTGEVKDSRLWQDASVTYFTLGGWITISNDLAFLKISLADGSVMDYYDLQTDTTLTKKCYPADAKAVGEKFAALEARIATLEGTATE